MEKAIFPTAPIFTGFPSTVLVNISTTSFPSVDIIIIVETMKNNNDFAIQEPCPPRKFISSANTSTPICSDCTVTDCLACSRLVSGTQTDCVKCVTGKKLYLNPVTGSFLCVDVCPTGSIPNSSTDTCSGILSNYYSSIRYLEFIYQCRSNPNFNICLT